MPTDKSFIQSLDLGQGIVAFNTTRGDNIDVNNPYAGFNACDYTGDDTAHVLECRSALCDYLNITIDKLIIPRQTHSLNVKVINSTPESETVLMDVDALVTNQPQIALAVNTADCVPILLADPDNRVIAAVHSGWRGTVGRIVCKAVDKMVELGADVNKIKAVMAPCICPDCFEVGDEVSSIFEAEYLHKGVVIKTETRDHVDLAMACKLDLLNSGLQECNITMPDSCTRCNPHEYFSARHSGINSGRMLSLIMLSK